MPKTKFQNFIFPLMTAILMAYPLQIFFVGPLVRNIFRIIFKNNYNKCNNKLQLLKQIIS